MIVINPVVKERLEVLEGSCWAVRNIINSSFEELADNTRDYSDPFLCDRIADAKYYRDAAVPQLEKCAKTIEAILDHFDRDPMMFTELLAQKWEGLRSDLNEAGQNADSVWLALNNDSDIEQLGDSVESVKGRDYLWGMADDIKALISEQSYPLGEDYSPEEIVGFVDLAHSMV